jgi:hypothetical protein
MNEATPGKANQAARELASFGRGSGIPEADYLKGCDRTYPPDAEAQGGRVVPTPLPCLEEMGDIGAAMDLLLMVQSNYARKEPGVSRAMRDVARNAVAAEIERYIRSR